MNLTPTDLVVPKPATASSTDLLSGIKDKGKLVQAEDLKSRQF